MGIFAENENVDSVWKGIQQEISDGKLGDVVDISFDEFAQFDDKQMFEYQEALDAVREASARLNRTQTGPDYVRVKAEYDAQLARLADMKESFMDLSGLSPYAAVLRDLKKYNIGLEENAVLRMEMFQVEGFRDLQRNLKTLETALFTSSKEGTLGELPDIFKQQFGLNEEQWKALDQSYAKRKEYFKQQNANLRNIIVASGVLTTEELFKLAGVDFDPNVIDGLTKEQFAQLNSDLSQLAQLEYKDQLTDDERTLKKTLDNRVGYLMSFVSSVSDTNSLLSSLDIDFDPSERFRIGPEAMEQLDQFARAYEAENDRLQASMVNGSKDTTAIEKNLYDIRLRAFKVYTDNVKKGTEETINDLQSAGFNIDPAKYYGLDNSSRLKLSLIKNSKLIAEETLEGLEAGSKKAKEQQRIIDAIELQISSINIVTANIDETVGYINEAFPTLNANGAQLLNLSGAQRRQLDDSIIVAKHLRDNIINSVSASTEQKKAAEAAIKALRGNSEEILTNAVKTGEAFDLISQSMPNLSLERFVGLSDEVKHSLLGASAGVVIANNALRTTDLEADALAESLAGLTKAEANYRIALRESGIFGAETMHALAEVGLQVDPLKYFQVSAAQDAMFRAAADSLKFMLTELANVSDEEVRKTLASMIVNFQDALSDDLKRATEGNQRIEEAGRRFSKSNVDALHKAMREALDGEGPASFEDRLIGLSDTFTSAMNDAISEGLMTRLGIGDDALSSLGENLYSAISGQDRTEIKSPETTQLEEINRVLGVNLPSLPVDIANNIATVMKGGTLSTTDSGTSVSIDAGGTAPPPGSGVPKSKGGDGADPTQGSEKKIAKGTEQALWDSNMTLGDNLSHVWDVGTDRVVDGIDSLQLETARGFATSTAALAGIIGAAGGDATLVAGLNAVASIAAVYGTAATGGKVSGPGTGTSDSIPMWLSNGEYVINARSTKEHEALLKHINEGGSLDYKPVEIRTTAIKRDATDSSRKEVTVNINVTGDVTQQTRKEIQRMLPEITTGVNITNKENGY